MGGKQPGGVQLTGPGGGRGDQTLAAERESLARPSFSIRVRVGAIFALLFVLLVGITVAAVLFMLALQTKQSFVEKASNFTFEIQQARRYEKDFFLYGTNLSDALASIHTARNYLLRDGDEIRSAVGPGKYQSIRESLERYEKLMERLTEGATATPSDAGGQDRGYIEANLRKDGAQLVIDAQDMIDRERLAMHSMLHASMVAAVSYLGLMFFVMMFVAGFLVRTVHQPLARFLAYVARIGAGDYSPITPVRKYRDEFSDLAIAINRMLRELTVRQDQLIQAGKMAAVGTLTSGIAHELNNPLNNIGLNTEVLVEDFGTLPDKEKLGLLDEIATQVSRANSIVRNLLDFTRKQQSAFTKVAIDKVLESTARLIRNELTLARVDLRLDLPEDLPRITGDPPSLQQVFLNLLLNAIQAMPNGGEVIVAARVEGDAMRIDVRDFGTGIRPENMDRIFDPFFTTREP
ncbi:MAG: ATP-binding protein, partial [bacterium]|nr:ATP-binding protein [bacterium]